MSCRDVCLDVDYDGGNQFYREVPARRARKPYHCCECGAAIAIGDVHHFAVGKTDGELFEARTCLACADVRATFSCSGWIFGDLWIAVHEQMFPEWNELSTIDCLAELTRDDAIALMKQQYAQWRRDHDKD